MTDPDTDPDTGPDPTDEPLAMLLGTANTDAPPPDPAFLARLREQTLAAFCDAAPTPPPTRFVRRLMLSPSVRWVAASVAVVLLLGAGVAVWFGKIPFRAPDLPDDEPFTIAGTLGDDGRIGKVTDAQGVAAVRPVLNDRWTPAQPRLVLKPGDWVRTDARGANAVALRLLADTAVVVGPHSTVELVAANELRVSAGELEVTPAADAPVLVHAPDKSKTVVKAKTFLRVEKEKLVRVEAEPLWLRGFKGTTANESLGSLIAGVDGRNVPLTVGYHHVTVDVRDQIARTVIEESFVNHTPNVLEGVFYFPLPPDASISGFGMWVGDQLVEADVVEKERAREIYETILREKRDPGLLEWIGGNVFKARVYPIPGNAEKRIKISYTQVLPLQGNRYRYSYALQSDLLKQHPLRDLKIDVTVSSATPLKSVTSPTHPARVSTAGRSGKVEFAAQEYTPTRDFEAVVEVAGRPADVVVVPHRRGDDGYFMLQLTPPGGSGDWERPLVPNGDPLKLVVLADTSASLDRGQRAAQDAVIASLFGALTPRDTVNLATCDVTCDWVFDKPVAASPENVAAARSALARRTSLGWTDLDAAFAAALKMCEPGTHVVYVGDGITTTGDADPVAFAKRLRKLAEGKPGTFHAVAVGSSFDATVMKAIGAIGGGSVRRVAGDRGPQAAALDLLTEIATPTLRDLKVEFTGVRTARVYPDTLPNIAAGTQQILLGRYLPEGKDQTGEVVVTGTLGGKPVRFTAKLALADAEAGNSFVPRLWARTHLDALLEQGPSDAVKQDVIALSEEFNIITPYTSLLVLESDADRERFAVKRRVKMRDGERFFADGKDTATFELKQKQTQQAAAFRTALRRKVLAHLATLGRDTLGFRRQGGETWGLAANEREFGETLNFAEAAKSANALEGSNGEYTLGDGGEGGAPAEPALREELRKADSDDDFQKGDDKSIFFVDALEKQIKEVSATSDADFGYSGGKFEGRQAATKLKRFQENIRARTDIRGEPRPVPPGSAPLPWFGTVVPTLPPPAAGPREPKTAWPAAAVALSRSLVRTDKLAALKGGIVVARQTDAFDPRSNDLTNRSARLDLASPTGWLARSTPDGGPVRVTWCDAAEYAEFTTAFHLGRTRAATKFDVRTPPLVLADYSVTPLHAAFAGATVTVEAAGADRERLTVKYPYNPDHDTRFTIDTRRHVLVAIEDRHKGEVVGATKFDDFAEVAGTWWAKRVERLDAKGRRQWLTTQTVAELPADEFAKRFAQELAGKEKVLFLRQPLPTVAAAKAAAAAGTAAFDDRMALVVHFGETQQWTRAREHFDAAEKLAAGKVGFRWLRDTFQLASRRHDELRKRLLAEATALAGTTDADALANDRYLANYLTNRGDDVLEANEQLALSDALRKVAERQPAHAHAMKAWRSHRVGLLERTGQRDAALALLKALATDYPRDAWLQTRYARGLAAAGDHPAAYAWLTRVLGPDANSRFQPPAGGNRAVEWTPEEELQLRELFAEFLEHQGRFRDLAEFLAEWLKRDPVSAQPYARYLFALLRTDQTDAAEKLVGTWLRDGQIPGDLPKPAAARLDAAVAFALGQGYSLSSYRVDERWEKPLADAARFFARHDAHLSIAARILQDWRFRRTDAGLAARTALADILRKDAAKLTPAQLVWYVEWTDHDAGMETEDWRLVAAAVRKRWDAEKAPEVREQFARVLVRILSVIDADGLLAFLREQWKQAPETARPAAAEAFFAALLAQKWSAEREDEAFAVLAQLPAADEPAGGLFTRVAALHRLTDAMLARREQATLAAVPHPEKLTRTELQKKRDDARKQAREGFAARLAKEAAAAPKPFADWLRAERVWLDVKLDRDLKAVAATCWEVLDAAPAKPNPDDRDAAAAAGLDEALRDRLLTTLENLAARKGADPALAPRLIAYLDRKAKDDPTAIAHWRSEKYDLLIALDRTKDLETELRTWVAAADSDHQWRIALGYLLAERGAVADAIQQFEAVRAADELPPAAYRSLADWYLAENRRADHDKAVAADFAVTDEHTLSQRLRGWYGPWRSEGRRPTTFDPAVFQTFKVLFAKATWPANYLSQLQQFYEASRDFRFLAVLADAVVGHTAEKVYPFLGDLRSVLAEVRDEATADELVARIAQVRETAKTPVDQRALDLLALLVERRAADLLNQPGPHAAKALAALERAGKREWSPGEPRLMADFLAGLGKVPQDDIAKEQLRQLDALRRAAAAGSPDRLHIAQRHAETLAAYGRSADAIDALDAALKEVQDANAGVLPTSANSALDRLVGFTEAARHYARGETILTKQLERPVSPEQKRWLTRRVNDLYLRAVENAGDVSLGGGPTLYAAFAAKLTAEITAAADQNHRGHLLQTFPRLYRAANAKKFAGVDADVRAFAFKQLPPVLRDQATNRDGIIRDVSEVVRLACGPRDGVAFLLDRIDDEPTWQRYTNNDAWNQYAHRLGEWRADAKSVGDLEPRLLKFVLAELRRDLRTRDSRSRTMYDRHHSHFWADKAADFAKVADEVYAERKQSSAAVEYVAAYVYWSLDRKPRAIEMLSAAHAAKVLSEAGQWQLVDYLHQTGDYTASVPILAPLVDRRPDNLGYRTKLMHAYFRTGKNAELLALLKATDAHFHANDRWTESALADLAASTLENRLFAESVAYYGELIPRHQRSHPNRGVGNGTLSGYYSRAADAYAGLGKTREAVDMASGAVVSWGRRIDQRKYALDALVRVLVAAPDLPGYVAGLDREPLQSAIVRKAIGRAFLEKNAPAAAVAQLQLAAELQPDDAEINDDLLKCYDKLGDKDAAIRQLIKAVEVSRRDIKLYAELGRRYAAQNQPAEAERAYTSVVEVLPTETEGHALLAEIREKQDRWPDAVAHWDRVAKLRTLEPTGLLKLAAAQIHVRSWDAAAESLRTLRTRTWPSRFEDVPKQVRDLERKLDAGRKK